MSNNEEESRVTEAWRQHIDATIDEMKKAINTMANNISSVLTIHASNASQISDNTRITLDLKRSMDDFQKRAMPAIEVTEVMQRGATAIGNILEFVTRWGQRIWRICILFGACWVVLKVLNSGGSWSEAAKAFFTYQH